MDVLDFKRVVKDFQYKPNFGLSVFEQDGKSWIRVVMLVEDARQPFRPWTLEQHEVEYSHDYYYDRVVRQPSNIIGYSPSRPLTEVMGNFVIPDFIEDELLFVDWLVTTVQMVENHETFEWLRYKGELINDPHKE